jgi:hypothetical protein
MHSIESQLHRQRSPLRYLRKVASAPSYANWALLYILYTTNILVSLFTSVVAAIFKLLRKAVSSFETFDMFALVEI